MDAKKKQGNALRNYGLPSLLLIVISCFYFQLTRLGYVIPLPYLLDAICLKDCSNDSYLTLVPPNISGNQLLNYDKPISEILTLNKIDKNKTSILIEKSRYRLTVYYDKKPIKSYPVVFGSSPIDDKLRAGDSRTPEGKFRIRDLYPHAAWSKFLWLDYPTGVSWRKHIQAKLKGKINWLDSIGGEIGIHGTPSDKLIKNRSNWTLGCISLTNKDVDELYQVVQPGTEVEIIR